jgi:TPP-dependent indolepyruvate ferredoxin oxidoreductase alpha subunit
MNTILIFLAIAVIFIYFFRKDLKEKFVPNKERYLTLDDQFNSEKKDRENEIDAILSKIGKNGLNDLSEEDRKRLDELSKKIK